MRAFTFASHGEYWVALLPEIILTLAAVVVLMVDAFGSGGRNAAARRPGTAGVDERPDRVTADHVVALAGIAGSAIACIWLAGSTGPIDALLAVDGFRIAADLILLGGSALVVLLARDYLAREGLRTAEFYALILMAIVGMMVLVAARDLVLLFVGLELMSISVYVLTGYARRDPKSSEASLKYFLVGAFASAFLLYGIALLYGATGTTRLATAASVIGAGVQSGDLLLTAGIGLFLIGFAFKVAAVPFHMWTPDAYEGAPTPVTAFMATGVKAAAFIALLRILTVDLGSAVGIWGGAVWWLAVLTMIVPNLIALGQDNVKRMLAYSSVAHAGYLLVGVAAASQLGRAASLFYLAAYTVMTIGGFAIVFHVAGKGDRKALVDDYRGLGWTRPGLGIALSIFLLSLAGFPPTAGFVGKLYLLRAAVEAGQTSLAVVLVLTSLVAYYYYLRVVWKMYFEAAPEEAEPTPQPGGRFRLAVGACAVLLLIGGLFPAVGLRGAREAVATVEPAATSVAVETPAGRVADGAGTRPSADE